MPFVHQQALTGNFLLSEANGQRSRENAVLAATAVVLPAGQLLTLGAGGVYAPYAGPGADADAPITADAVLYDNAPVSEGEQMVVAIVRDAEVSAEVLYGLDDEARASLAREGVGIIVRD